MQYYRKIQFRGRGNVASLSVQLLHNDYSYEAVLMIFQFGIIAVINMHNLMFLTCIVFDTGQFKLCTWSKMIDFR